ncbi:MAG: glycosyltransferase [Myxococcota bacterium]|nr:glycosyltransferase [Myxococcota bacterium]
MMLGLVLTAPMAAAVSLAEASPATLALLLVYFVTVALLSVFGSHRLVLVLSYLRNRSKAAPLPEPLSDALCPTVLLQLPVYNERLVVERLIDRVADLDWPRDRLRIQVLDDSNDDTTLRAARAVERHRAMGLSIELVHRKNREGFKAGALQVGLETDADQNPAPAPFVAIFDADFLPRPDFLRRALQPLVQDETLGMAQARWTHINRSRNLLTRAQAILLDGHFIIEHGARFRAGRFFNFNGTAGVWRRKAIEEAGGWKGDTLTEDLDLSYRAQLAGWRFCFLQELEVPAELPEDARAFKTQQHRWAKGSIQTARKLLPNIWRAPLPLGTRLEATFHLAANLAYPLMVLLLLLLPITLYVRTEHSPWLGLALDMPAFLLATASLLLFYSVAERELGDGGWLKRLPLIPFVLGLGASLTPNNSRAVWEALTNRKSPFVRTPKTGGTSARNGYRQKLGIQALIETAWGLYFLGGAAYALGQGLWVPVPFLVVFAAAFLLLGLGSFLPAITHSGKTRDSSATSDLSVARAATGSQPPEAHSPARLPNSGPATSPPQLPPSMRDRRAGGDR